MTLVRSESAHPKLSPRAAFYLQASIVLFFLAGSSAPTPLYALYRSEWGFSAITTTVVFGVYALAVLLALLIVGSLSDHIGRRPVLLAAISAQIVTMLIFTAANGVPELFIARIIQGLSTGTALGAVGAGMLDIDKAKGTVANAVAPVFGTASGALGAGLLAQFLPAPTHTVYLLLMIVFIAQGLGVLLMAETSAAESGALASLKLQFALPPAARRPFLAAVPVLVAVWALAGFYGSLGPALVGRITGSDSLVLGGLGLFALAATGGVSVLLFRRVSPRTLMLIGTISLIVGAAVTLIAVAQSSTVAFFAGTVIAGIGFGTGFQAAIRSVIPLAAPHERAGVLSILFVVSYLAMGLPAVIAGLLVVYDGGVLTTAREYGIAIIVLAAIALLGASVATRRTPEHLAR